MTYDSQPPGCWPAPDQVLLLRAALEQGDEALAAWRAWRQIVEFDRIDSGSQKLLPLVYANLSAMGVKDSIPGRLKGHYRLAWYKNQMLFRQVAAVLLAFEEAGLEALVLKGVALALQYYQDAGQRPMLDFDILVQPAQARRAASSSGCPWGGHPKSVPCTAIDA